MPCSVAKEIKLKKIITEAKEWISDLEDRMTEIIAMGQNKEKRMRTSLVVHWLRFHAPNAGGSGSIPGQATRCYTLQLKITRAATKRSCTPQQRLSTAR